MILILLHALSNLVWFSLDILLAHEEGGIYVGGYEGAKDLEMLKRLKIRAVLTSS